MSLVSKEDQKDVRREQIELLVASYYEKLEFLRYEPLELLIDKALDLFLDSDLTIDEINEKLLETIATRKKELDERYDNKLVQRNHETIYGRLELIARALNKAGVDYQLAGALCVYIKYGEESDRCHDDIDFCVNEEDLDKFGEVCTQFGFQYEDSRMKSPRVLKNGIPSGEHEVIARDPHTEFHVGVFPFERKENGYVIMKGYYHDEDSSPCVREEIFSADLASEIFGNEEVDFRGTPITITPPEYVYRLKGYTRQQKDLHDMAFLEGRMDEEKLARISELSKDGKIIQNVPVDGLPDERVRNSFSSGNDELGMMLADEGSKKNKGEELGSSREKEGAKMLVKKNQQDQAKSAVTNEEGFISNTIITTLALITFVLCFIGIAVIYLVQM